MPDNKKTITVKAGQDNIGQWRITDEKAIALNRIAKSLESIEKALQVRNRQDNSD